MKKRTFILIIMLLLLVALLVMSGIAASASEGEVEINESISELLKDLDLSELQKYLDEHSDSYLFNFGNNASEIVEYLINGNLGTDDGSYLG